jgi:hypothetical protein
LYLIVVLEPWTKKVFEEISGHHKTCQPREGLSVSQKLLELWQAFDPVLSVGTFAAE